MPANERNAEWSEREISSSSGFLERHGRDLGGPWFTLGDAVAAVVSLVMVCGPLAFGALGL